MRAAAGDQFDREAERYPSGNPERDDIVAVKGRALALLDALPEDVKEVRIYAWGSHNTSNSAFNGGSLHLEVAPAQT